MSCKRCGAPEVDPTRADILDEAAAVVREAIRSQNMGGQLTNSMARGITLGMETALTYIERAKDHRYLAWLRSMNDVLEATRSDPAQAPAGDSPQC